MPYPFNDMQGGMFGPPGGTQNLGGGMGQMTDRDLEMLLGQMRSGSQTRGTLPVYDSPAPAGGPASPQGVPGLRDSGIDPSMIDSGAGGGLQGMDFGPQGDQMGGMRDAIMSMGRQKAEEERIRKLLLAAQGGGTLTPGMYSNPVAAGGGGFNSLRGGTGSTQIPPGMG